MSPALIHSLITNLTVRWLIALLLLSSQALADNIDKTPRLMVLGDSLSAAYGIDQQRGWVALLSQRLQDKAPSVQVVNASISGETTSGGLARLPQLLDKYKPALVIIELGGNDGLRGHPINAMQENLQQAIDLSREHNAQVLLLGMQLPPNYGPRYSRLFGESYSQLAAQNSIAIVPFFLDKVATNPLLMQSDGIHPTEQGQPILLDNVWPHIEAWLPR